MDINNSQNAVYVILDLPKLITIAWELTLLGRYETSLKKYQIALEIIQAKKKSNEIKKKKLQEKEVMVFDMSNGNKSSDFYQNYFGSAIFL